MASAANDASTRQDVEKIRKWRRVNLKDFLQKHPKASPAREYLLTACFASTLLPVDFDYKEVQKNMNISLPSGFDLTHAKLGLRLLAAAGEAADVIAPLKTAALVALEIVECVDAATENQERCKVIAEDIFKLMEAISIEEFRVASDDRLMSKHVKAFLDHLQAIRQVISGIMQRNKSKRFYFAQSDAQELDKCEVRLDKCRDLFMLNLAVENRRNVMRIGDMMDMLLQQQLNNVSPLSPTSNQWQAQQPATPKGHAFTGHPFAPASISTSPSRSSTLANHTSTPNFVPGANRHPPNLQVLTQSPVPASANPAAGSVSRAPSRTTPQDGKSTTVDGGGGNAHRRGTPAAANSGGNENNRTVDSVNVLSGSIPGLTRNGQGSNRN